MPPLEGALYDKVVQLYTTALGPRDAAEAPGGRNGTPAAAVPGDPTPDKSQQQRWLEVKPLLAQQGLANVCRKEPYNNGFKFWLAKNPVHCPCCGNHHVNNNWLTYQSETLKWVYRNFSSNCVPIAIANEYKEVEKCLCKYLQLRGYQNVTIEI